MPSGENQVQARDRETKIIIPPPHTVLVSNWKGTGRRVRINADTYDPARDGEVVEGSDQQHFAAEVAAFERERFTALHVERPPGHAEPGRAGTSSV